MTTVGGSSQLQPALHRLIGDFTAQLLIVQYIATLLLSSRDVAMCYVIHMSVGEVAVKFLK